MSKTRGVRHCQDCPANPFRPATLQVLVRASRATTDPTPRADPIKFFQVLGANIADQKTGPLAPRFAPLAKIGYNFDGTAARGKNFQFVVVPHFGGVRVLENPGDPGGLGSAGQVKSSVQRGVPEGDLGLVAGTQTRDPPYILPRPNWICTIPSGRPRAAGGSEHQGYTTTIGKILFDGPTHG